MPSLAKSSDDGCHFCRMVISAVRAEYRHLEEEDRISACHRVSLDEMRFRWSEKRGLSLLEVEALFEAEHGFCVASLFFEIGCPAGSSILHKGSKIVLTYILQGSVQRGWTYGGGL